MDTEGSGSAWRTVDLNGMIYENDDPVLSGREILGLGGYAPATEHVLIEIWKGRTHLVNSDDKVDLKAHAGTRFPER